MKINLTNKLLFGLFVSLLAFSDVLAQGSRPFFIGLQPTTTKERGYARSEFDMNVVPIMAQLSMNKNLDFRIVSIVQQHFGPDKHLADVGIELSFPLFFGGKRHMVDKSQGFYAAPLAAITNNKYELVQTTTIGIEPGYQFLFKQRFGLIVGMQFGTSFLNKNVGLNSRGRYFKLKVTFGIWGQKTPKSVKKS